MTEGQAARRRQRLRRELRALRVGQRLTQADAAAAVGWSESKVNRIEAGTVAVTPTDVQALLEAYQVRDQALAPALVALAQGSRRQPWSRYRDLHSPAFLRYLGYEGYATRLREFAPLFVPGLLQTRSYSAALLDNVPMNRLDDEVKKRVLESRALRQELLESPDCPAIHVVLDETVVHREIGGSQVMAEQLDRLVRLSSRPRVSLQVMPAAAGAYVGMDAGFILLDFDEDPPVVYLEGRGSEIAGGSDSDATEPYRRAFAHLSETALPPGDSRSLLARLAKALR